MNNGANLNSPWDLVGLAAAFLTMFGFLPQVIKMYRSRSVGDISLWAILQFTLGIALWLIYGIHRKDLPIILANSVTLLILFAALAVFFKYCPRAEKKQINGG